MFLHKGLHFDNIVNMIGYAIIDDAYVTMSEEYKTLSATGKFECSNEHSAKLVREYYDGYIEYGRYVEEPDF